MQAIEAFKTTKGRPTLIILDSHIGYGSPHKQDTPEAHGEPLGEDESMLVKRAYGWPEEAKFLVPDGVYEHFAAGIGARGASAHQEWNRDIPGIQRGISGARPADRADAEARTPRRLGSTCRCFRRTPRALPVVMLQAKTLNVLAQSVPWFVGGAADLGPSNKTLFTYSGGQEFSGRDARWQE